MRQRTREGKVAALHNNAFGSIRPTDGSRDGAFFWKSECGSEPSPRRFDDLPDALKPIAEAARPFYEKLAATG